MRNQFYEVLRRARMLKAKPASRTLADIVFEVTGASMEPGFTNGLRANLIYCAADIALRPQEDMQRNLARKVLNGWGTRYGLSAPAMDSPRFEGWSRITHRGSNLRDRLTRSGRLVTGADNCATGVVRPADPYRLLRMGIRGVVSPIGCRKLRGLGQMQPVLIGSSRNGWLEIRIEGVTAKGDSCWRTYPLPKFKAEAKTALGELLHAKKYGRRTRSSAACDTHQATKRQKVAQVVS